jgi:hypothetical protein
MAYSNGYNLTSVLPVLFGRLGWSTGSGLNTDNTTSNSGRRFDDSTFHAAVSVANVKDIFPIQTDYDAFFTSQQNAAITKALSSVFSQPEFKEQVFIYDPLYDYTFPEANTGKAVGYKIELSKSFDMAYKINSLQLYFDSVRTFNVYLFKHGSKIPLKTQSVTTVANERNTVSLTDWILNYKEAQTYYVVYFQSDLTITKALMEDVSPTTTYFFDACPFTATTSGTNFDRNALNYFMGVSYGLNLQVSSFKDYTQHILNQPHLFDELIGLTMAQTVLENIIYSTESNAKERILKTQVTEFGIQLDLNGQVPISESPKIPGLKQRIDREVKRIKEAFYPQKKQSTINALC